MSYPKRTKMDDLEDHLYDKIQSDPVGLAAKIAYDDQIGMDSKLLIDLKVGVFLFMRKLQVFHESLEGQAPKPMELRELIEQILLKLHEFRDRYLELYYDPNMEIEDVCEKEIHFDIPDHKSSGFQTWNDAINHWLSGKIGDYPYYNHYKKKNEPKKT